MLDIIDTIFFKELQEKNPDDVCKRTRSKFDKQKGCYTLKVWGEEYEIHPEEESIEPVSKNAHPVNIHSGVFILFYLLKARDKFVTNEWISEKDIPGGAAFFRGPHAIPTHLIVEKYGSDIDGFKTVCESFEGEAIDMGDAAYSFRIVSRIPVAVIFWRADEEFPAEVKMLFDRTINEHLPLDVIFGLTYEICLRLSQS